MALKGSLKDFPIASVFQMISMDRKKGRLSVQTEKDTIIIEFDAGEIVNASHGSKIDEKRLRLLLVKNKHITDKRWREIKKECNLNLIPVRSVLGRYLKKDTVTFLANRQMEQVIFDLLSLKEGEYVFDPEAKINIDNKIAAQVGGDRVIMEGYRIIDEWEAIANDIPPINTNICRSEHLEESLLNTGYKTTDDEDYMLKIVSEPISIEDALDSSLINKPRTGKALANLLSLGLLSIVTKDRRIKDFSKTPTWNFWGYAAIAVIIIFSTGGFYINYTLNNYISFYQEKADWYKANTTKERLGTIARSLSYYYTMYGEIPLDIHSLVDKGYLKREEIIDSWGTPFIYKGFKDSFMLISKGASGDDPGDDIYYQGSPLRL